VSGLSISVSGVRVEDYAAVPTLMFQLAVSDSSLEPVHAIALRVQVMIEPQKRRYEPDEEERLLELFGETPRWGETLRPFLWAHSATMVQGFTGTSDVDLPFVCSYDFEVAAAKYLHALEGGDIPLNLLFSGTVFRKSETGMSVMPVAWDLEAAVKLPVKTWRALMDRYFPNSGWMRLRCDTIDLLQRFKATRGLLTYDQCIELLVKEAEGRSAASADEAKA
jgi:hypothetical protein